MEAIIPEIQEIIRLDSTKDYSYMSKIDGVMAKISMLREPSEQSQMIMILLNFIKGNFSVAGINTDNLGKLYSPKVEDIIRRIDNNDKEFLPNPLSQFYLLKNSKDPLVVKLGDIALSVYKKKQIDFISGFYSKINLDNLKNMLGDDVAKKLIDERGWKIDGNNFVIINDRKDPGQFDQEKAMKDLQFYGKNNLSFNRLTKENYGLVEYVNKP